MSVTTHKAAKPVAGSIKTAGVPLLGETNPLTGGNDFSGDVSTLKLPAGVTDLTTGAGGVAADTLITVATSGNLISLNAPSVGSPVFGVGLGGYPRRKTISVFEGGGVLSANLAGSPTVSQDWSEPFIGQTFSASNASFGNVPTNGVSIKANIPASADVVIVQSTANSSAVNVVGGNIYLQINKMSGTFDGNLQVRLYSGASPSASSANYHQGTFQYPHNVITGDWQTISVPIEAFSVVGAGADTSAITHAGVRISSTSGTVDMLIGSVFFCPKVLSKGAVIVAFDDCRADTWTDGAKYMVKRGIPGVLYPGAVASTLRTSVDQFQMSLRQMEVLQRLYGWQIAAQAWDTENPSGQTNDEFSGNLNAQKAFYAAAGWAGSMDGSYFSNVNVNSAFDAEFRRHYRSMRGYKINSAGEIGFVQPETAPIGDPYYVRSVGVDTAVHTAAHLTAIVDKAIAQKGVAIFTFHGVTTGTATFTGLIDYLDTNRATVDSLTMDQLVHTIRARAYN